jgi:hypothetical protein
MAGVTPARHQLLLAIRGHPDPAGPTIREMAGRPGGGGRAGRAAPGRRRFAGGGAFPHRGWGRSSCPAVRPAPGGAQAIRAAARSAVGRIGHVPVGRVGSGDLRPGVGLLGLVKFGQCPPYLGSDALKAGQCGHAGDGPEHEPEQEDGLHLLFLPDHSTGRIGPRCSIVARQRDTGSITATRRRS